MLDVLSVGESKKAGNHHVFAGWEQEQQEAALDIELRAWDCLGQLLKRSVSPYTAARLTPGVGRVPEHLLQSHPAENPSEQVPSPSALPGATVYLLVPGSGCTQ